MSQFIINEEGDLLDTLAVSTGTLDNPFESLIFIAVHWTGLDFSFLNALHNRYSFKWDRWQQFKDILKPMTFHCFRVKGYRTATASRNGFSPIEHVAEFPGIHVARAFNKAYFDRWHRFHDAEDPEDITRQTDEFVSTLRDFSSTTLAAYNEVLAESITESFKNEISAEDLAFALAAVHHVIDLTDIVDTSPLIELLTEHGLIE